MQAKMKRSFSYILCFILSFCVFSCKQSSEPDETQNNTQNPEKVEKQSSKQDSIIKALEAKIDTLTVDLNSVKKKLDDLNTETKKVGNFAESISVWNYMTLAAILLGIVSLLLLLWLKSIVLGKNDVENIFKHCMDESHRLSDMKERLERLENTPKITNNSHFAQKNTQNVESRVSTLENQMRQVIDYINKTISSQNQKPSNQDIQNTNGSNPIEFSKTGYAKINSGMFFMEIFDSQQEGCVYKINFKNKQKGEFDLISLDKIKSRNEWQLVIEFTGNCTMAEATRYKLLEYGIIEKIDAKNTWEVKKKLKIQIFK